MSNAAQTDFARTADSANAERIDVREFLTSCALCSLVGLGILAGLAQTLVTLWGPVV